MKKILLLALLLAPVGAIAADGSVVGRRAHDMNETRISLGLPSEMKQHQLANMRAHLQATHLIIGLLAERKFKQASKIAHTKLGLTEEMRLMCDKFENEDFKKLGLAFHNSADELGDVLQTKNMKKSLQALSRMTGYCVQCHEKYRQ